MLPFLKFLYENPIFLQIIFPSAIMNLRWHLIFAFINFEKFFRYGLTKSRACRRSFSILRFTKGDAISDNK